MRKVRLRVKGTQQVRGSRSQLFPEQKPLEILTLAFLLHLQVLNAPPSPQFLCHPEPRLVPTPLPPAHLVSSHYGNSFGPSLLSPSQLPRDQRDGEHILKIFLLLFLNVFFCLKECYQFNHIGKKKPTPVDQDCEYKTRKDSIK